MDHSKNWKMILSSLEQGVPVMLLYVLESNGSSPGRQGFFMGITEAGEMQGSIGGGIMEHKFVEMAKDRLESGAGSREPAPDIRKQVHDKSAKKNQSGMICSGEQTILLYDVREENAGTIKEIIVSLEKNRNGRLTLSPEGIRFDNNIPAKDFEYSFQSESEWLYIEKTGYKNLLTIIGGGHCALALSKLMCSMDFYIRIYDERKNLNTMIANDSVHEKHFIDNYTELKKLIEPGSNHFVVIMTFGYRTDDVALRALIGKDFKYLGLLGSKTKVAKMFDDYREEGIDDNWLQRIYTPVGLAIKSQTPEEIAVSIAAEVIKIKNRDSATDAP